MADKIKIVNAYDGGQNAEFVTQINPASVKIGKKISYEKIQAMGREEHLARYKHHEPSSLSFDIYMDDTGVVPDNKMSIQERIDQMEEAVYKKKKDLGEPGYVILVWGTIIFHGRAESIDIDYTLFAPDGTPLRVKISLSFVGYFKESSFKGSVSQTANVVTFQSGDTLAASCAKIYGDASYCVEVAAQNGMDSIRNTPPGTTVQFPPVSRN